MICGESGDVSGVTVDSWKERLPEICKDYTADNIWNLDETGCFWRALPDRGLGQMKASCKGGKKSKNRVTVALFANATGMKEKPVVIYKSAKPRCFKRIDKKNLPVSYYHQEKAWMSGEIMYSILNKLNTRLVSQRKSILLFMDNAGCHPEDLKDRYTNIRVIFLPPNTTSLLQPLDLGIIQTFKMHYRKLLLTYILSKIDECTSASELAKSVDVLQAIRWIGQAWSNVSSDTIKKCFRNAGILDKEFKVVSEGMVIEDPFADLDGDSMADNSNDDEVELAELIEQVCEDPPDLEMYLNFDQDIMCQEFDDDNWNDEFFSELDHIQGSSSRVRASTDDEDEEDEADEPAQPKIKTVSEAIDLLEQTQYFLDFSGYESVANDISAAIDKVAKLKMKKLMSAKQSHIDEYFSSC